jgi:hypothetical protein
MASPTTTTITGGRKVGGPGWSSSTSGATR